VLWENFTLESKLDPFLLNCSDPVPIIQVSAKCYRDGRITPKGNPVRSGTVEDAIRVVGQAFTHLGGGASVRTSSVKSILHLAPFHLIQERRFPAIKSEVRPHHHRHFHPFTRQCQHHHSRRPPCHCRSDLHRLLISPSTRGIYWHDIIVIFILSHASAIITIPEYLHAIADLICIAF
jgi:hypothetical protein